MEGALKLRDELLLEDPKLREGVVPRLMEDPKLRDELLEDPNSRDELLFGELKLRGVLPVEGRVTLRESLPEGVPKEREPLPTRLPPMVRGLLPFI